MHSSFASADTAVANAQLTLSLRPRRGLGIVATGGAKRNPWLLPASKPSRPEGASGTSRYLHVDPSSLTNRNTRQPTPHFREGF